VQPRPNGTHTRRGRAQIRRQHGGAPAAGRAHGCDQEQPWLGRRAECHGRPPAGQHNSALGGHAPRPGMCTRTGYVVWCVWRAPARACTQPVLRLCGARVAAPPLRRSGPTPWRARERGLRGEAASAYENVMAPVRTCSEKQARCLDGVQKTRVPWWLMRMVGRLGVRALHCPQAQRAVHELGLDVAAAPAAHVSLSEWRVISSVIGIQPPGPRAARFECTFVAPVAHTCPPTHTHLCAHATVLCPARRCLCMRRLLHSDTHDRARVHVFTLLFPAQTTLFDRRLCRLVAALAAPSHITMCLRGHTPLWRRPTQARYHWHCAPVPAVHACMRVCCGGVSSGSNGSSAGGRVRAVRMHACMPTAGRGVLGC